MDVPDVVDVADVVALVGTLGMDPVEGMDDGIEGVEGTDGMDPDGIEGIEDIEGSGRCECDANGLVSFVLVLVFDLDPMDDPADGSVDVPVSGAIQGMAPFEPEKVFPPFIIEVVDGVVVSNGNVFGVIVVVGGTKSKCPVY